MKLYIFKILIPISFLFGYLLQFVYCSQKPCIETNTTATKTATLLDKIKAKNV